jgi:hypothetical protein
MEILLSTLLLLVVEVGHQTTEVVLVVVEQADIDLL